MTNIRIAKIAGMAVGATIAFGAFVPMAGAVTVAELQAQINALMAQLASLQGTPGAGVVNAISSDLTVGSSGNSVVTLQQALVAQGYLTMPSGVAMGYFGSLTKAAVQKWQAANGVSATGYFGPISRAKFNGSAGATGTVPGTTVGTTPTVVVSPGVITTPGVEGTVTVSLNPSPSSGTKLYEGDVNRDVLGIKLEAKSSDIRIERVKIDMDNETSGNADTEVYRKIAQKIYIKDGSTVLASMDLNANTIVKDGANYFITLSGLSYVVPKGTTKILTVALDAMTTWDSGFDNDSWSLGIPVDGVRGIDGAGVNQYGPSTAFTRTFDSAGALVDAATLAASLNTNSPKVNQSICELNTDNDECDNLEVLRIDFKAEKDAVTLTDLVIDIVRGGNTSAATNTTAYVYDGSTLVGSASVVGTDLTTMGATFSDIDWVIPKDTTKVLTVKLDIRDATAAATTFAVDIDTADMTAENSAGAGITESGSAAGKTITVRKLGPEITLVSKSITTNGVPQAQGVTTNVSTSTLTATFNIKIKALGGDLNLGTVASGTPVIASSTASFKVYRNGAYDGVVTSNSTSTSYTIPSGCTSVGTNSCTLAEGSEVTIPVTFQIQGRTAAGVTLSAGLYAVGFEGITWHGAGAAATTTTFMAGEVDWRTADVSFP
ncbi:MAG: peptidoglycan-binding domain-containing protein [bacterium]|nr:peptidoglycan-binding domain-containing protein [bacterium]